jgi:hypothetical protein
VLRTKNLAVRFAIKFFSAASLNKYWIGLNKYFNEQGLDMHNDDLRKLLDHMDRGGRTTRELDPRTGRVVTTPVYEGEIGRKIGSTIGSVFGDAGAKFGGDMGDKAGDALDRLNPFSKSTPAGGNSNTTANTPTPAASASGKDSSWNPPTAGRNADGSFNSDHPFVLAMNKKMAANRNPGGNGGHDGSGIDANDNPEDPKTWPPGVKPAPDFGYLDASGMWIPTPFDVRTEDGDWKTPRNSPANLTGIPHNKYTPFQLAVEKMKNKAAYTSASPIEQVKPVSLPNGAPQIPGFKQVDAARFSQDAREPGLDKSLRWVYAYQKGKDFVLIAPQLFYNTSIKIGRHYDSWVGRGIRTDDDRVPSANGTVFVTNQHFNSNDKILSIVVHTSLGAGNIGPNIIKSISGSLTPV